MVIDRRKFIAGSLVLIFAVGINSNSFPWPVHSVQETSSKFLRRRTTVDGTAQHIT